MTGRPGAIVREVPTAIAHVEPSDEYGVILRQMKRAVHYSPDEADRLADDLHEVAARARTDLLADEAARGGIVHGFDIAPVCRDCREGKHGACIGSTFIETADDLDEVECGCAKAEHPERAS